MAAVGLAIVSGAVAHLQMIAWVWVVLIPIEMAFPRGGQLSAKVRLKGLALGVVTWAAMGATAGATVALLRQTGVRPLLTFPPGHYAPVEIGLALIVGSLAAVLATDFLYYWFHRLQHHPAIWRFHAVHHGIEDLNAANYSHWTEGLWRVPFMTLPLYLLMPAGLPLWPLAGALATLQSQYLHSPTRLHFGPFWRLAFDNRFHRIHHSVEPQHFDKNFGVNTPLWDWMFGTLYVPSKDEWPDTGIVGQPDVDGLADYLWRPFRQRSGAAIGEVRAEIGGAS